MSKKTEIEGNQVHVVREVRASKDLPKQEVSWTLDFSGVTKDELLELASRTLVITLQGRFRNASADKQKEMLEQSFDIRQELDAERRGTKRDPQKAIEKDFGKLDSEAKRAMLAKLQAELDEKLDHNKE